MLQTLTPTDDAVMPLLAIKDLCVEIRLREGIVHALRGVTLALRPHRVLGLVGESGCGKTMVARAILRILPPRAQIVRGSIHWSNAKNNPKNIVDLAALSQHDPFLRRIRGGEIAIIFQEPMSSLSPVHTVGAQIAEAVKIHLRLPHKTCRDVSMEMLRKVGIPRPERVIDAYPHQLSGGLRQRSMIAMALSCQPRLLIADEPTTALDVTIQSQILDLLVSLQKESGMSVLFITHDLGVIAGIADAVGVMYHGRIIEQADVETFFARPLHPYAQGLLNAAPRLGRGGRQRLVSIPGSVPQAFEKVLGCPFHPRCSQKISGLCERGLPPLHREVEPNHFVACHLYADSERGSDSNHNHLDSLP